MRRLTPYPLTTSSLTKCQIVEHLINDSGHRLKLCQLSLCCNLFLKPSVTRTVPKRNAVDKSYFTLCSSVKRTFYSAVSELNATHQEAMADSSNCNSFHANVERLNCSHSALGETLQQCEDLDKEIDCAEDEQHGGGETMVSKAASKSAFYVQPLSPKTPGILLQPRPALPAPKFYPLSQNLSCAAQIHSHVPIIMTADDINEQQNVISPVESLRKINQFAEGRKKVTSKTIEASTRREQSSTRHVHKLNTKGLNKPKQESLKTIEKKSILKPCDVPSESLRAPLTSPSFQTKNEKAVGIYSVTLASKISKVERDVSLEIVREDTSPPEHNQSSSKYQDEDKLAQESATHIHGDRKSFAEVKNQQDSSKQLRPKRTNTDKVDQLQASVPQVKKVKKMVLSSTLLGHITTLVRENLRTFSTSVVTEASAKMPSDKMHKDKESLVVRKASSEVDARGNTSVQQARDKEQSVTEIQRVTEIQSVTEGQSLTKCLDKAGMDTVQTLHKVMTGRENDHSKPTASEGEHKIKEKKKKKKSKKKRNMTKKGFYDGTVGKLPEYIPENDRLNKESKYEVFNLEQLFSGRLGENADEVIKPKKARSRANYFYAVQISSTEIKEGLRKVQDTVGQSTPKLKPAFVPIDTMHVTLTAMHLPDQPAIDRASALLDKLQKVMDHGKQLHVVDRPAAQAEDDALKPTHAEDGALTTTCAKAGAPTTRAETCAPTTHTEVDAITTHAEASAATNAEAGAPTTHAEAGAPTTTHAEAGALTTTHAEAGTPTTTHAEAGAPTTTHAEAGALTTTHAEAGALTTTHAEAGTPTTTHAEAGALTTTHAEAGAPTTTHAEAGAPTTTHAEAGAPTTTHAEASAPTTTHAEYGAPATCAETGAPSTTHAEAGAPTSTCAEARAPATTHIEGDASTSTHAEAGSPITACTAAGLSTTTHAGAGAPTTICTEALAPVTTYTEGDPLTTTNAESGALTTTHAEAGAPTTTHAEAGAPTTTRDAKSSAESLSALAGKAAAENSLEVARSDIPGVQHPLPIELRGLGHFNDAVIFSRISEGIALERLTTIAEFLKQGLILEKISVDSKKFEPHATIMKLSKNIKKLKKDGIKKIPRESYADFKETIFGTEDIASVQLCSMLKSKKNGYYFVEYSIDCTPSHAPSQSPAIAEQAAVRTDGKGVVTLSQQCGAHKHKYSPKLKRTKSESDFVEDPPQCKLPSGKIRKSKSQSDFSKDTGPVFPEG